MSAASIIPDAEIDRVHGGNFGDMTNRYSSGYTQLTILMEHGLVRKPRPGHYYTVLTKKGQRYLRAVYGTHFASIVALDDQG